MKRRGTDDADGQEIAELAALADGSLAPERRAALEAQVAASSELAARLAEQERAVALARSAAAEVEAPAGLRARIEAQRRPRRASRPRRLVWIGGAVAAGCRRRRHRADRLSFEQLRPELPRRSRRDRPGARRRRRRDARQDGCGLADRARRDRASPPRRRAVLRGVAEERRRRARPDRDVQRRREGHAVGGRVAEGLHDDHGHAREGRRRPGFVGREGARRNGRAPDQAETPSIRRTTCWRAR